MSPLQLWPWDESERMVSEKKSESERQKMKQYHYFTTYAYIHTVPDHIAAQFREHVLEMKIGKNFDQEFRVSSLVPFYLSELVEVS